MQNAVKEEVLDYTSFVSLVKEKIIERMGQGYSIKMYKVIKNNSLELDCLAVLKEGANCSPNIYLNAYYESFIEGTSMAEIIDRLCMIYTHSDVPVIQEDFEFSLELMKPYIFFRLVSLEKNKKLLTQVPHTTFLDLAITFHCLVKNVEEGIGSIRITNEHMDLWDIGLDELKDLAFDNTKTLFPPVIKTMEDVISGLLFDANIDNIDIDQHMEPLYPMYILSNEKGINGASCLLYNDVIRDFSKILKSDLYILPSSIHEIILVPMDNLKNKENFTSMVAEINMSQVPFDEVLSDHVYIYSRERDAITI